MPESVHQDDTVAIPDVDASAESNDVFVIMSRYHYRDRENYPKWDDALLDEEGWFEDRPSANTRCAQLNEKNRTRYDTVVATAKREHEAKVSRAERLNREAAAIRAGGMTKDDVPMPSPFEPMPFEKFLDGTSHTDYAVVTIHRSDHDGIARAVVVEVGVKSGAEEDAPEGTASSTA